MPMCNPWQPDEIVGRCLSWSVIASRDLDGRKISYVLEVYRIDEDLERIELSEDRYYEIRFQTEARLC